MKKWEKREREREEKRTLIFNKPYLEKRNKWEIRGKHSHIVFIYNTLTTLIGLKIFPYLYILLFTYLKEKRNLVNGKNKMVNSMEQQGCLLFLSITFFYLYIYKRLPF